MKKFKELQKSEMNYDKTKRIMKNEINNEKTNYEKRNELQTSNYRCLKDTIYKADTSNFSRSYIFIRHGACYQVLCSAGMQCATGTNGF